MSNTSDETKKDEIRLNHGELSPTQTKRDEDDLMTERVDVRYRFVNKTTGTEFPPQRIVYEGDTLKLGDIVELHVPERKTDYFCVESLENGGDVVTAYLVRARNSLWKTLLMLAILGAAWVVIDYIVKLIF